MKNIKSDKNGLSWLILSISTMFVIGAICTSQAQAQMPARFYWKTLSGGYALPLLYESMSGNTNPFDPSQLITSGAKIDASLGLAGYARTFSLYDRSAMAAVIVPMGRISSDVTVVGHTTSQSVRGYGDPMLEFDINIIGPKRRQKSIPDALAMSRIFCRFTR